MHNSNLSNLRPIFELAGKEHSIAESTRVMRRAVRDHGTALRDQGTAVVGAFQIACSDESERENIEIFHTEFVRELLPKFKFWKQSSFRTSNLGGRYEPGSASIAEDHYALVESQATHKVMLVKVSSHVSVSGDGADVVYGVMDRYERASVYCGAMHGLLAGSRNHPFLTELDTTFRRDGLDRLAFLSDPARVEPHHRALNTAICNTLLQAERAEQECIVLEQHTPTVFVIVSCVTINRLRDDTELVCGVSVVDRRADTPHVTRRGPGTDPRGHVIEMTRGSISLQVQDH